MEYRNVRRAGGLDFKGILDSAGSSCVKPNSICQYLAKMILTNEERRQSGQEQEEEPNKGGNSGKGGKK